MVALPGSVPVAVRGAHVGLFAPYVVLLPSDFQCAPALNHAHDITSTTAGLDARRASLYEADE